MAQTTQKPIIKSILDLDFYKLTMGQWILHRYPDTPVTSAFKNRTRKVKLAEVVDERDLRRELDPVQNLKLTGNEAEYLRQIKRISGQQMFGEDYIEFLRNPQIPDYRLEIVDGNYHLTFEGPWKSQTYWETFALPAMNELYYRALTSKMSPEQVKALHQEGRRRLEEKVNILLQHPLIKFIEFGTRRRFSQEWQDSLVEYLKQKVPEQMTGTSNVYLAMKHGLAPKGTMAHELFMVLSGIMHKNDEEIRASHNQVLKEWWEEYDVDLSVALTDTYGSEFFFKDFTDQQARDWKGLRQDSGNPAAFGEKQIAFYHKRGVDLHRKLFVPSDGLEIGTIVDLTNRFNGRIKTIAGWGTSLTNDLGLASLSLVVKAIESCGYGTVKLSDNPAKAMGSPEDIARFMRIFEYDPTKYQEQECKY